VTGPTWSGPGEVEVKAGVLLVKPLEAGIDTVVTGPPLHTLRTTSCALRRSLTYVHVIGPSLGPTVSVPLVGVFTTRPLVLVHVRVVA
jgi:hypothetical protein